MCKWCENIGKEAHGHDKKKRQQKENPAKMYIKENRKNQISPRRMKGCRKNTKGRNGKKLAHVAYTSIEGN